VTDREVEALVERTITTFWRDLRAAFGAAAAGLSLRALATAIGQRNASAAAELVRTETIANALARLQAQLGPVREAGWQAVADGLPRAMQSDPLLRVTLGAKALQEPSVLEAIRRLDTLRLQGVTNETDAAIRAIIERGIRDAVNPNVLAKEIRAQIGLTRQGALAVARYRAKLVADGRKPDQIERMVGRYAAKRIAQRAQTIAVTEVSRAQNEGRQLQWDRMIRDGLLNPGEWEKEWVTAADERVCPICGPAHGQRQPVPGLFDLTTGALPHPPAHPNCRCIARLVPFGFRAGERPAPARDRILDGLPR